MRLGAGDEHLTYCSNIHPGESWAAVRSNLERYFTAVHQRVAPDAEFGVGLRLSAQAARELAEPAAFEDFRDFLQRKRLYVFTINGFPYGTFHDARVKEAVYLPDWRDEERLRYTDQLAELLSRLLPVRAGMEGSVSTVPCAYKPEVKGESDVARMADNFVRHVARLIDIERKTGRRITLAIEPEPYCYLETIEESVGFFERHLFGAPAIQRLGKLAGLDRQAAAEALQERIGLCLDLCHAAVEFEEPAACLQRLVAAGIRVHKLQISAGLHLPTLSREALDALKGFDDPVYLHQVVERSSAGLRRFADLPEAFASLDGDGNSDREWRVHFHVPIFFDRLEAFSSTQFFIRTMLELHRSKPISKHLEVETYTWNVLPERLRSVPIEEAVARELNWVRGQLNAVVRDT